MAASAGGTRVEIAAARKRARGRGFPPLPGARCQGGAHKRRVPVMKVYAERAAAGHGGRRLLMERGDNMPVEDFELHPAARRRARRSARRTWMCGKPARKWRPGEYKAISKSLKKLQMVLFVRGQVLLRHG